MAYINPEDQKRYAHQHYLDNSDVYKQRAKTHAAVKRRENYQRVDEIKRTPCADCNQTFDPVCMDFDHLDGEKKFDNVATMILRGFSWKNIELEIAKCEVVCACCHRLRTKHRRGVEKLGISPGS